MSAFIPMHLPGSKSEYHDYIILDRHKYWIFVIPEVLAMVPGRGVPPELVPIVCVNSNDRGFNGSATALFAGKGRLESKLTIGATIRTGEGRIEWTPPLTSDTHHIVFDNSTFLNDGVLPHPLRPLLNKSNVVTAKLIASTLGKNWRLPTKRLLVNHLNRLVRRRKFRIWQGKSNPQYTGVSVQTGLTRYPYMRPFGDVDSIISAGGSARNPLAPPGWMGTPAIDFEFELSFSEDFNELLRCQFWMDSFPAYEAYISVDGKPAIPLLQQLPALGTSPWNLYNNPAVWNQRQMFPVRKVSSRVISLQ